MKSVILAFSVLVGVGSMVGCAPKAAKQADDAVCSRAALQYSAPHSSLARHGRVSMLRERTGERL